MQLKIQRSQRTGGFTGSTVFFALDVRAEYSAEEKSNIAKYKLGSQVIYNSRAAKKHLDKADAQLGRGQSSNSLRNVFAGLVRGIGSLIMAKMHLNISIASLGKGHHIECKDLDELLEAEDTVRQACKGVTRYLDVAATFDGSEVVIAYENGEERVHITQSAQPLLSYGGGDGVNGEAQDTQGSPTAPYGTNDDPGDYVPSAPEALAKHWHNFETKVIAIADEQGVTLSLLHVRLGVIAVGILSLYILVQIL
jgi:hypothetical protein